MFLASIWRAFADRGPQPARRWAWPAFFIGGAPQLQRQGPTVSDIEKFTGQPAMEPIRTYAGLASASEAEARATLAVRDLKRAGGFQRKNLLDSAGEPALGRQPGSVLVWLPFVTFWQVTADLAFATGVPPGHGHTYTSEYVDGWNTVLRPVGITGQELAELRSIVADDK